MQTNWQGVRSMTPRIRLLAWVAVTAALLAPPTPAAAQDGRLYVDINGGIQATTSDFADNVVFTEFVEQGDFDATYAIDSGVILDIGGGVRLPLNLGAGVGFSRFDKGNDASVDARIPHPFFFDSDRSVAGSATNLTRTETAVHVQVRWFAPVPSGLRATSSGRDPVGVPPTSLRSRRPRPSPEAGQT